MSDCKTVLTIVHATLVSDDVHVTLASDDHTKITGASPRKSQHLLERKDA